MNTIYAEWLREQGSNDAREIARYIEELQSRLHSLEQNYDLCKAELAGVIADAKSQGCRLDAVRDIAMRCSLTSNSSNYLTAIAAICTLLRGDVETHEPREWSCPRHGKFVSAWNRCPSCAVETSLPKSELPKLAEWETDSGVRVEVYDGPNTSEKKRE